MKFNYNITGSFFKIYNQINGAFLMKKRIKKHPDKKVKGYVFYVLFLFLIIFLTFFSICIIIGLNSSVADYDKNIKIPSEIFGCFLFVPLALLFIFIGTYWKEKKTCKKGALTVEEDGILDFSNGMTLKYDWNKIDFILFQKNLVMIIPKKTFVIMYAPLKNPKRLFNAIQKKNKDVLLINQINT